MPVSRSTKLYGGTAYRNGEVLDAPNELEPDIAALAAKFDANIVDADVSAGAGIEPTKVSDFSSSTEYLQTGFPPDSYNQPPVSAPDLTAELKFLRYCVKRLTVGQGGYFNEGAANDPLNWGEPAPVSSNLLRNSSFELLDGSSVPISWSTVGTATFASVATAATMGAGNALEITPAANDDGITQTVKGIKANVKYLIGISARDSAATETITIQTTGAKATLGYRDISYDEAIGASFQTIPVIVQADNLGTDIQIEFLSATGVSGNPIEIDHAFMYELSEHQTTQSTLTAKTVTLSTETAILDDAAQALVPVAALSISVTPPAHNYMVRIHAHLPWAPAAGKLIMGAAVLLRDGSKIAQAPMSTNDTGFGEWGKVATIDYVDTEIDAGTAYTYSISIIPDSGAANDIRFAPNLTTDMPATYQQQTAYLTVELVPIS
jgi:hypothetical protein